MLLRSPRQVRPAPATPCAQPVAEPAIRSKLKFAELRHLRVTGVRILRLRPQGLRAAKRNTDCEQRKSKNRWQPLHSFRHASHLAPDSRLLRRSRIMNYLLIAYSNSYECFPSAAIIISAALFSCPFFGSRASIPIAPAVRTIQQITAAHPGQLLVFIFFHLVSKSYLTPRLTPD